MKNLRLFLGLAMMTMGVIAEAKSELSVMVTKSEDGTKVYADVVLANEASINSLVLDLNYPKELTFVKSGTQTLTEVCDSVNMEITPLWNVYDKNFADYNFVRVIALAKSGNEVASGSNDKFIRISFDAPANIKVSEKDFTFNNASAASGVDREELRMPIGTLGRNGYLSYSTTQDMLIEGATAYYGSIDASTLHLEAVAEGEAVCHGQGIVLKGKEGTVVYGTSVESAAMPGRNDLKACVSGDVVSAQTTYVLATKSGVTGFYPNTESKIEAGESYLKTVANVTRISFDFNAMADQDIFDIYKVQGQRFEEMRNSMNAHANR